MIAFLNLLLAATFTALGAFVPVRVPFLTLGTPVLPDGHELLHWKALSLGWCTLSLQVPAVWIAGMLLGARLGMTSQLLVLAVGLAGLPIFADGGGLHYLAESTFGYLLGFVPAALIIGASARKGPGRLALGLLAGQAAMWAVGLAWQIVALKGLANPAVWLGSLRGTLQLAPSYLVMMAALVAVQALAGEIAARAARRPSVRPGA